MSIKNYKSVGIAAIALLLGGQFSSCVSEGNDPGIEYAPNMYVSEAYEAYTQKDMMKYNPNGMTMRLPVPGTIARGQMDYAAYAAGYEASSSWSNPVAPTKAAMADGEMLYIRYCSHCHGKDGKNDGLVVKNSEYPPPPFANYQTEYIQTLPVGKIFHTITFGKGLMGSHASVLTPEQRWKVTHHVKYLSNPEAFQVVSEEQAKANGSNDMSGASNALLSDLQGKGIEGFEMAQIDPTVYGGLLAAMRNVQFEKLRMTKIKDESFMHLDKIADYLKANPSNIVLGGHTARDIGMDAAQGEIALKRAQSVKDYLISKGIGADRIKTKSFGSDMPVASNDTEEGRSQNRRVEIYFVK
jgi:mono/diheme cytochrome c family protein